MVRNSVSIDVRAARGNYSTYLRFTDPPTRLPTRRMVRNSFFRCEGIVCQARSGDNGTGGRDKGGQGGWRETVFSKIGEDHLATAMKA